MIKPKLFKCYSNIVKSSILNFKSFFVSTANYINVDVLC